MAKKKKSKRVKEVVEEVDVDDFEGDEVAPKQPGADAYTGLVVMTTLCLITATVLFYMDGDKFANAKGANPNVAPNALVAAPPAVPTKG